MSQKYNYYSQIQDFQVVQMGKEEKGRERRKWRKRDEKTKRERKKEEKGIKEDKKRTGRKKEENLGSFSR